MTREVSGRSRRLHVAVVDEVGRSVPPRGLSTWLNRVAPARGRGRLTLALLGDSRVRRLNRRYRGVDRPTDVLSFPSAAERRTGRVPAPGPDGLPSSHPFLGDVVIATGVARRQARAAGHSYQTELRILALHGLLHLLGYDHERDNGRMARLERRLRRRGGLREGLTERWSR